MTNQENIIEDIVDMFFAQKSLYQRMIGEYVDKKKEYINKHCGKC